MSFAFEYVYFMTVFQIEYLPQPALCESLRDVCRALGRVPSRDEFVLFLYQPCEPQCEYDTPFDMWFALANHVIQRFGLFPRCSVVHCAYRAYLALDRMPMLTEFFEEIERRHDVPAAVMNEWMESETDALWARRNEVPLDVPVRLAAQDDTCCLCLDAITSTHPTRTLACGHTFHSNVWLAGAEVTASADCEGIETWLERCASCPLCKRALSSPASS